MLTLTFLGVGSAFAKRSFQSNALIEAWASGPSSQFGPDDNLLIDFGTTGPIALHQLKDKPEFGYLDHDGSIRYPAIRRIFITHQHADHIGGLEELALMNTFVFADAQSGRPFRPQLISAARILANLWDHSLRGGLDTQPGRCAVLEDYFCVLALQPGRPHHEQFLLADRYRCEPFPTHHVQIERKYDWPALGLLIRDTHTGESAFYSGDTQYDLPAYREMMESAKVCFHDCQLIGQPQTVHAPLSELRKMPASIRKKTWLYHYGDTWDSGEYDFVSEEFAGFAVQQQRTVLFD